MITVVQLDIECTTTADGSDVDLRVDAEQPAGSITSRPLFISVAESM